MSPELGRYISSIKDRFLNPEKPLSCIGEIRMNNGYGAIASVDEEKNPKIKLMKNGEEILDFIDFAPPHTSFELQPEIKWGAGIFPNGKLKILLGEFRRKRDILDLGHEIGHLVNLCLTKNAVEANKLYEKTGLKIKRENSRWDIPEFIRITNDTLDVVFVSERKAWDFAIDLADSLDNEYGLEILKSMGGRKGAGLYKERMVKTHEDYYIVQLSQFGVSSQIGLQRVFARELGLPIPDYLNW